MLKTRLKMKIKKNQPIKNEEQLEVLKDESTVADKKPKEIVLLKDKLDFTFKTFGSNFNNTGKKFIKLAKDEKKIDYNNLLFEIVILLLKVLIFCKKLVHGVIY